MFFVLVESESFEIMHRSSGLPRADLAVHFGCGQHHLKPSRRAAHTIRTRRPGPMSTTALEIGDCTDGIHIAVPRNQGRCVVIGLNSITSGLSAIRKLPVAGRPSGIACESEEGFVTPKLC